MDRILGYGEDALTLWALRHRLNAILNHFNDKTAPSDCLIFYRPSFGRSGGDGSSEFGEFDAIVSSPNNIYLVESKWDNLGRTKRYKDILRPVQRLRHDILSWYVTNWNEKYHKKWKNFKKEQQSNLQEKVGNRKIPSEGTMLAKNLEFILTGVLNNCRRFSGEDSIKNVLLFFYIEKEPEIISKERKGFDLVFIDYGTKVTGGNFIALD